MIVLTLKPRKKSILKKRQPERKFQIYTLKREEKSNDTETPDVG